MPSLICLILTTFSSEIIFALNRGPILQSWCQTHTKVVHFAPLDSTLLVWISEGIANPEKQHCSELTVKIIIFLTADNSYYFIVVFSLQF